MKQFKRAVFIFRRDLRLHDNSALMAALDKSETVLACFIFDPRQIESGNRYRADNCVQFMLQSLFELDLELIQLDSKLRFFHGEPPKLLDKLHARYGFDALFFNRDYTPFSLKRDSALESWAKSNSIHAEIHHDLMLNAPADTLKADGTPYTVFTPFFKRCAALPVREPKANTARNFEVAEIKFEFETDPQRFLSSANPRIALQGGRKEALAILERLGDLQNYVETRDLPALSATSMLSAHNKFGTLSIREVYHAIRKRLGAGHPLIRQLYWRDFFTQIGLHFPHVFGANFNRVYDKLEWQNSTSRFDLWCSGETGFPIVDAGMRELNTTGFMHNRVRMITASFLVKDLHLDWRWGERYFATKLIDYDPCVNNGNWQWAASTGCDAQPYFRIFNPWLQQAKFDADCSYIKRWIPELQGLTSTRIHKLGEDRGGCPGSYPAPMLDHAEEKLVAEQMFESARGG